MLTLKLYAHSTWATSYCDVTRQSTVKLCSKADSTHSSNEQPVSTGSNLPWRATNSYTCHETNLFW